MKKIGLSAMVGLAAVGCYGADVGDEDFGTASQAVVAGETYRLVNVHANKCLDVAGASTSNGANINLWSCNGGAQQSFTMEDMGSGYYRLRNVKSGKCVDVAGVSTADGANVQQWSCGSGHNQQFSVEYSNGVAMLRARHSGKALDGWNWGTGDGTNIVQWPATGATNQRFQLVRESASGGTCGEFKYELEATLAAQVGRELGRWESDKDFYISPQDWSLKLTQEGLNRCASRGKSGCPGVSALLAMQFHGQNQIAPNHDPSAFRNALVSHHQRYMTFLQNNMLPITQTVDLNYEASTPGSCGPMHWYRVDGLSDTSKLHYKLIAYGATPQNGDTNHENPYIQFQSTESKVGIDPTYDLQDGQDGSSSGSCVALPPPAAAKVDCSGSINGQCCQANGKNGTFKRAPWNYCTYLCN